MEDKYNQLHLEHYSKELANLLCDRHFASHDTINGPQLINFTPIKQVNLFAIKELLLKWHYEMANLRSVYFDFESDEVKEALLNFMNVLSRKILMKRNSFEPLLQKAILDTFLVVLSPVSTFEDKFLRIQEEITLPKLQENLKYIEIDKPLFAGFIETLSPSSRDREYILSRFKLYVNANQEKRTSLRELTQRFNSLLPISEEELAQHRTLSSYEAKPTPPAPTEEKDIVAPIHMAQREASVPSAAPIAQAPAIVRENNINERFRADRPTFNENFAKQQTGSLVSSQGSQKIDSLKNSISINQRFSFINELFEGDNITYYQAIQKLEAMQDLHQAKDFVTNELASKYNWSRKQEHVDKLLRLLERKFS